MPARSESKAKERGGCKKKKKPPSCRIRVSAAKIPSSSLKNLLSTSKKVRVASAVPAKSASARSNSCKGMHNLASRACSPSSVYVLELQGGKVYVGKSKDTDTRLKQHINGDGSSYTKKNPPTGKFLARLGTLEGEGDGPERDETLRQMYFRGIDNVRGWKFCTRKLRLNAADHREAESNIRELFDLCRRCGRPGHFARFCRNRIDRHGNAISSEKIVRGKTFYDTSA